MLGSSRSMGDGGEVCLARKGLMTLGTCRSVGSPAEGTKSLRVDYSLYSKEMILSRRLS